MRRVGALIWAAATVLLASACGRGISADPSDPVPPHLPPMTPPLSGVWQSCAKLGTGGPDNIALSRDGSTLAVLFRSGQAAVHRVSDGKLLLTVADTAFPLPPDQSAIAPPVDNFFLSHSIALSPDGSLLAVSDGNRLGVWRVADGVEISDLRNQLLGDPPVPAGGDAGQVMMFSPDGTTFLALNEAPADYSQLDLRRADSGALIHRYLVDAHPLFGTPAGFSADGRQVLVADGQSILVYDADGTGDLARTVALPDAPANGGVLLTSFSPSGRYLAGAGETATGGLFDLLVFSTDDGTLKRRVPGVTTDAPIFSIDETAVYLFNYGRGDVGRFVVDIETGTTATVTAALLGPAAVGAGGKPLILSDASGVYSSADPWAGAPFASFPTLIGQRLSFMAAAVSPDGRWLATSTVINPNQEDAHARREEVVTWDLHARLATQEIPGMLATGLAFSTDDSRLLIAGADATEFWIQERRLGAAAPDWKLTTSERTIWNAVYAPSGDGTIAVSLSDGVGIAHVGDNRVSPALAAGNAFPGIAFSPVDSGLLATSDPALWRIADGGMLWSVGKVAPSQGDPPADRWAAFSPDGRTLVASELHTTSPPPWDTSPHGMAGTVDTGVYRASDGQLLADAHGMLARRPSFSPDGRWVAAANQVANIASAATVQLPLTPAYQNASVSVFAPDGSIAVARDDGLIEIFCPK